MITPPLPDVPAVRVTAPEVSSVLFKVMPLPAPVAARVTGPVPPFTTPFTVIPAPAADVVSTTPLPLADATVSAPLVPTSSRPPVALAVNASTPVLLTKTPPFVPVAFNVDVAVFSAAPVAPIAVPARPIELPVTLLPAPAIMAPPLVATDTAPVVLTAPFRAILP